MIGRSFVGLRAVWNGARRASGYASAPLGDVDLDSMMLEKVLRQGGTAYVGASCDGFERPYELLGDLIMSDEVAPEHITVGHRLIGSGAGVAAVWREETKAVFKSLGRGPADVAACFLTGALDAEKAMSSGGVEEVVAQVRAAAVAAGVDLEALRVGVDVSADVLNGMDIAQATALAGHLRTNKVQALTVGCSPYSLPQAAAIFAANKHPTSSSPPLLVATDVLRVHRRRPGQLARVGRKASTDDIDMTQAVEDFKKALDVCMHTETKYLKEMAEHASVVVEDPTRLCWGHVLAQAQGSILFPEEWYYLQKAQAEPAVEASHAALRGMGRKDLRDFALLHGPLTQVLFASFDRVLQARKQSLVATVAAVTPSNQTGAPYEYVAALLQASGGADIVCVTGTDFNAANVENAVAAMRNEVAGSLENQVNQLRTVYDSFDAPM